MSILIFSFFAPYAKAAPNGTFADKYAAIVVDANTGKTLFQANANARRYPASLTKMMTLYMLFEAMQSGRVNPNTPIPVSAYAAARQPTKIGFKPGQTIPAESAAKALITKSANDVAAAIGEYLGGSEQRFAQIMTTKARRLGMMNTNFANASGLPDVQNYSTARDMAILSMALREHFPNHYTLFKTTSFQFRGQTINGHNRLVKNMKGVDGIKTGYTRMSGSNLATSMQLNGRSIVAVVMGGRSSALRDAHMAELLRTYMPKASRSKTRAPLLAATLYNLPEGHKAPIPVAKANINNQNNDDAVILTALAGQQRQESSAINAVNQAIIQKPENEVLSTPVQEQPNKKENIDPIVTASTPAKAAAILSGWAVQIGSLPNQEQADAMLVNATATMQTAFSSAQPQTQIFDKDGQRYYRARFAGFQSKKSANDACAALKKAKFNCYAISQ
ncbi:SPOR domain-containing protein [Bartonella tamiae]|nr:SPOR domain-containing protein [Bartonella tamiae]